MIYKTNYPSAVGNLLLVAEDESLVGLWIVGQKYFLGTLKEEPVENENLPVFHQTKQWLDDYFAGKRPDITFLSLKPKGSDFRQIIWDILCQIPYGQVATYGDIAKEAAKRLNKKTMSAQAVGNAIGHNPISIIIPCHRVVGTNGSLTGYAGGIDKKIKLLELEGIDTKAYFVPKTGTAL